MAHLSAEFVEGSLCSGCFFTYFDNVSSPMMILRFHFISASRACAAARSRRDCLKILLTLSVRGGQSCTRAGSVGRLSKELRLISSRRVNRERRLVRTTDNFSSEISLRDFPEKE